MNERTNEQTNKIHTKNTRLTKKEKTYSLTGFAKLSLGRFPVIEMRLGSKDDVSVDLAGTGIHTPTLLVSQQETEAYNKKWCGHWCGVDVFTRFLQT